MNLSKKQTIYSHFLTEKIKIINKCAIKIANLLRFGNKNK